jgi:hypothetical protein
MKKYISSSTTENPNTKRNCKRSRMLQSREVETIDDMKEKYAEYLEMVENPYAFMLGVMANKILKLEEYIDYLKKRIEYVS